MSSKNTSRPFNAMRIKLLAFLALLSVFSSFPSPASCQDTGSDNYWSRIIQDKREELANLKAALAAYMAMNDYTTSSFKQMVEEDNLLFHQTSYMLTINESNPFEFKLACLELSIQTSIFKRKLDKMEAKLESINRYCSIVMKSKDELEALKQLKQPAQNLKEIEESLSLIDGLSFGMASLKEKTEKALKPAETLLAERQKALLGLRKGIENNIKLSLLTSYGAIYDEDFFIMAPLAFNQWISRTPALVERKMPASRQSWLTFIFVALAVSAMSWGLLQSFMKPRLKKYEARKRGTAGIMKRGQALLALGVGLSAGTFSIPLAEHILPLHFALIFILWAALEISWGFKLIFSDSTRKRSPLYALFAVSMIGAFLQAVDTPSVALGILWTPLMLLLAFSSWKTLREPDSVLGVPQKRVVGATIALAALSACLSLCGFAIGAVIIIKSWFLLALSFHFASALSAAIWNSAQDKERFSYIANSIIIGFAIPSAWLAIIVAVSLCIIWQIIDIHTCIDVIFAPLDAFGTQVTPLSLILVIFLFFVVKTALRVLGSTIEKRADGSLISKGEVTPFKTFVSCVLWMVYALVVVKILGMDLTHMGVIIGGLSIGVGFGMQNFVNNLVSGLMLLFGRDIREGDIIQIGDTWAKIQKISLRSTIACTSDNAIISIPNSNILSSQVINWTLNDKHIRRDLKIPITTGGDMKLIRGKLLSVAASTHGIMPLPEPEIVVLSVEPNSIVLTLRVWLADIEKTDQTLSELNSKIEAEILHPIHS